MGAAALALSAIGSLVSAGGSILAGQNAKAGAKFEAKQLDAKADRERAQASREADQQFRNQQELQSNQQAAAAASGGGASDPTILDLMSDTSAYGFTQRQQTLGNAENAARGYEGQADARRIEGRNAATAGFIGAGTSLLGGLSDGLNKYQNIMGNSTGKRYGSAVMG